jgi:cytochrome c oxidase cbb3-type subunit III
MKLETTALAVLAIAAASCGIRGGPPGRRSAESQVTRPDQVTDFSQLYSSNCAGCHGAEGKGSAAVGLADPVYLAIADDATIRSAVSDGIPGTAMPAFVRESGGMLTKEQVDAIVKGIRGRWEKPDILRGIKPPPYAAEEPGDPERGAKVYAVYCSSCHGVDGRGGERAGSIVDSSFLALMSDQGLRTTVIVGRPAIGAPDWRGNVRGKVMTDEDISNVVSWLVAHRTAVPGQPYSSSQLTAEGAL